MPGQRQLHLNAFIHDVGHHEAAWRLLESDPFAPNDVDFYIKLAQTAEAGALDSIFFADAPALFADPAFRPASFIEPTVMLAAIAVSTHRIGLIATASTTYNSPYNLARRFAAVDHISGGRAGWNIVTTSSADAAHNFGQDGQQAHFDRYERATEFLDVVTRLWDSWEDGAVVGDQTEGVWADPAKVHRIEHEGKHFKVRGPLNSPRSPQGHPVLVQAGSSLNGRIFAGRYAEAVFTAQRTLEEGQAFYADLKQRASENGRREEDIVILPGVVPYLGSTEAEAQAREQEFTDHINPAHGLLQISRIFGVDLTGADLDEPLPEVPFEDDIEGHKSRSTLISNLANGENLTVRQLLGKLGGGRGHRTFTGTPEQLADDLELWFTNGAADGFNIMPPAYPADLETFIDQVVPILRKRGLFRERYKGSTLRDHYGLPRPESRYAAGDRRAEVPAAV
jgi:FMN-dependent oxidoreductase (nitrilotriacetate monooxygenase family)